MADAEREALLTAWVDRYSDSLLRMCFISLRDWALAEDALQETFIKAWRAMPQYEHSPIRNERAWLSRIAVNVCRDLRRTRWMRHVDAAQALEMLPPSQLAVEPEDRTLLLDILAMPEKIPAGADPLPLSAAEKGGRHAPAGADGGGGRPVRSNDIERAIDTTLSWLTTTDAGRSSSCVPL